MKANLDFKLARATSKGVKALNQPFLGTHIIIQTKDDFTFFTKFFLSKSY